MIETQNLILRRPNASDWEAARDYFTSERAVTLGGPYPVGQAWRLFATHLGHWDIRGFGQFAVTQKGDDRALGLIGAWYPIDWPETEIGWTVLAAEAEGKGIAFEAAEAALSYAFDVLKWTTAVSYIKPTNTRSVALAKRLGAEIDSLAEVPARLTEIPHVVYRHPRRAA